MEQASHAARWAEHYFARALQLDPTDATVWLACALFKESLGDHATRRITDHLIAEIRAGTLSARPDRSLPTVGITPRIIRWRRLILDSDDPGKALSELVLVNALELAARLEPIAARRIALLEEAATTVRDDPDTASALAEELILQDEFAEALPWLQLVHDRRPLSPNNWSLLVRTLLELRRVDEARALLEQCGAAAERLPVDPAVVALLYERLPA